MLLGASLDAYSQTRNSQRDRLRNEARARNGYNRPAPAPRSRVSRPSHPSNRSRVTRTTRPGSSYRTSPARRPVTRPYRPGNTYRTTPTRRPVTRPATRPTPRPRSYTPYRHNPYRHNYVGTRRYSRTSSYVNYLRQNRYNYFYRNWIFHPSTRPNGYYVANNYPYFVFNGYQHRYSNVDICDYQLVDRVTDTVVRYFNDRTCSYGYDECARERDRQNDYAYEDRYFCAESYQY